MPRCVRQLAILKILVDESDEDKFTLFILLHLVTMMPYQNLPKGARPPNPPARPPLSSTQEQMARPPAVTVTKCYDITMV